MNATNMTINLGSFQKGTSAVLTVLSGLPESVLLMVPACLQCKAVRRIRAR